MTGPLHIDGLMKRFGGDVPVLGPLHLTLDTGCVSAVIGKSGCGKSTLLRCLGGLERPDEGVISLDGETIRPDDVAIVFQEPRLMPWLTVAENVAFGLGHVPRAQRKAQVADVIEVVGLQDATDKLPKQLSGGMAQRVALARALAVRPRLLLLDEPFSALDPLSRVAMQDHLLTVWRHYRPTIIFITHDMDEALALAERIVVMDGPPGRIIAEFMPSLPFPRRRTGPEFQRWRDRLVGVLGG